MVTALNLFMLLTLLVLASMWCANQADKLKFYNTGVAILLFTISGLLIVAAVVVFGVMVGLVWSAIS